MVVLNRIYTRTGDDGTTSLGSGDRRKKYDLRVDAYGTLDEVNAVIGLARLHTAADPALDAALGRIQNDLFDVEADLCLSEKGPGGARLTVTDAQVTWLEGEIDRLNEEAGAAEILHPARRQRGLGLAASRPHGLPARRAHHGRAHGPAGRGRVGALAANMSTGCRTICSSPAAMLTTKALATCCGRRGRTADLLTAGEGRAPWSFHSTTIIRSSGQGCLMSPGA